MAFLALSVFSIGVLGTVINRRNILILLMSFEIMYLGAHLNFACASSQTNDIVGLIFNLYALAVVGAESCLGLAIIATYYAVHQDVSLNTIILLRR